MCKYIIVTLEFCCKLCYWDSDELEKWVKSLGGPPDLISIFYVVAT